MITHQKHSNTYMMCNGFIFITKESFHRKSRRRRAAIAQQRMLQEQISTYIYFRIKFNCNLLFPYGLFHQEANRLQSIRFKGTAVMTSNFSAMVTAMRLRSVSVKNSNYAVLMNLINLSVYVIVFV